MAALSVTTPTTSGGITAPEDSVPGSFYAGVADIGGKVILHTPSDANADSAIVAPLGSASIRLSRNEKADGSGACSYVTEVKTGANGSYAFKGLAAGYYLMATTASVVVWNGFQTIYVAANTAVVAVDINVYRN